MAIDKKLKSLVIKNGYLIRFIIVGGINTLNYFVIFRLLLLISTYIVAHVFAFLLSAFISYFLTCMFTFKKKPSWGSFIKFPLTFLPNFIMSFVGTIIFVEWLNIDDRFASLIVMIAIIPITFIINKLIFIGRKKKESELQK